MLPRLKRSLLPVHVLLWVALLTVSVPTRELQAQTWTPAGQMVGPLMWEYPFSLPDGTQLIPLRSVNAKHKDSLYWYDVMSITTTPKMYVRQTPVLKNVIFVGDFDSDGSLDLFGNRTTQGATYLFSALTSSEHTRPPVSGQYGFKSNIENRYFGDVDGDGLSDDYIAETENAARIVYGHTDNPFIGISYVELYDNSREIYPNLPPTKVVLVGMLSGKPCIVQSYQLQPDTPPFYELHELNIDDLRARAPKIRTRQVQRINTGENRRYGNVVLRTDDVWWLFNSYGKDSSPNGIKITQSLMTLEEVSDFWLGGWQQYFGHRGYNLDESFPRVLDGARPFVRLDRDSSTLSDGRISHHDVFTYVELEDAEIAKVKVLGRAQPPDSTIMDATLARLSVVSDLDQDSLMDLIINYWYRSQVTQKYDSACVALFMTTQRPTVTVPVDKSSPTDQVIDLGEAWRIVNGAQCYVESLTFAQIYDISGSIVASVSFTVEGTDLIIAKPRALSNQVLWLRLSSCTLRLQ